MNRNEVIKKMGKYAALTALGSFLILTPLSSQANSPCHYPKGFLKKRRCKRKD